MKANTPDCFTKAVLAYNFVEWVAARVSFTLDFAQRDLLCELFLEGALILVKDGKVSVRQ